MLTTQAYSREDTLLWLQHLDLFSDVPQDELALLLDGMEWVELRGGDPLLGGADVYIVRYGSLGSTLHTGPVGGAVELAPVGPGEILGEISVIAGISRPTSVVALRHCGLLRVEGAAFRRFLERSHRGTQEINRHLARSLVRQLHRRPRAVRPGSIALVAVAEGVDLMAVGRALVQDATAQHLAAELLSNLDLTLGADEVAAAQMLNDLTVLVTCRDDTVWDELCLANADRLLFVDAVGHKKLPEPALRPGTRPRQIDVVTLCPADAAPHPLPERWLNRTDIAMHLHVRAGRAADMGFLARITGGRAIGLVLAGGGARGFAHLGVIRALREAGIPIDLLGGTSMGAIVAAGAAFEWDDAELLERMRQVFGIDSPVNDYTVPIVSLTRGNKVATRLRQHFGERTIESAWRPFFAVSTNLSTCAAHVHRRGPVWRALRASSALPGILPPMVENGEILVDGAVMNNFPVDIMQDLRRGPVIGVDMPRDAAFVSPVGEFETMSALRRVRGRRDHPVNIFSVISRTATASSLTHTQRCRERADLLIDPEVQHVGLLHWNSLATTAEAAYRTTMAQLAAQDVSYASLLAAAAPPG
jgi:NTE family protein